MRAIAGVAAIVAAAVVGLLALRATGITAGVSTPAASAKWTDGEPPFLALPGHAQPLRAAFNGTELVVLASRSDSDRLSLFRIDPAARAVRESTTPLLAGNTLVGLAVDEDGSAWVAALRTLARVDPAGAVREFVVPPARHALPFPGPASPPGLPPTEDGQVTSLATVGDRLLIGRLGKAELTSFDLRSETFDHHAMPPGVGDVNEMAVGPRGQVVFAVRRSGAVPGRGYDAIGVVEPTTLRVRPLAMPARTVAASGTAFAFAGSGLGLLGADATPLRPVEAAGQYDQVRIALRPDATTVVRVLSDTHEIAYVGRDGKEQRRVTYQVVIGKDRRGRELPYSSAFSFVVSDASGVVWFALWGRPEIYRIE